MCVRAITCIAIGQDMWQSERLVFIYCVYHILREIYPCYVISFVLPRAAPLTIIISFLINICIASAADFLPSLHVRIRLLIHLSSNLISDELSISNCSFQFSVIFHLLNENPEPSAPLNSAMLIFLPWTEILAVDFNSCGLAHILLCGSRVSVPL